MSDLNNPNTQRDSAQSESEATPKEHFKEPVDSAAARALQSMKHFTVEHARDAVIRLKIRTKKQYKERYTEDPRLPEMPNIFYKSEWAYMGGWKAFLYSPASFVEFEELRTILSEQGIYTKKQYLRFFPDDERVPADPASVYAKEWQRRGGWPGLLPSRFMSYQELKLFVSEHKIKTKRQYQDIVRQHPRAPCYPANTYGVMWAENGKWRGLLDKPHPLTDPEKIWQLIQALKIRSLKDLTQRDDIDSRLRPECVKTLRDYLASRKDLRFVFYTDYESLLDIPKLCQRLDIKTVREYYSYADQVVSLPKFPNSVYAKHGWQLLGGWKYILSKPISLDSVQKGLNENGITDEAEYALFKSSNPLISRQFEQTLTNIQAYELKSLLGV